MSHIPLVDLKASTERSVRRSTPLWPGCLIVAISSWALAVDEFEEAFAQFIGTKQCVGVASGTDALQDGAERPGHRSGPQGTAAGQHLHCDSAGGQ